MEQIEAAIRRGVKLPENVSGWLVGWRFVTIMGNTMPPRDPNDDDEDEDGDTEPDELDPAVVREPDELYDGSPIRTKCPPAADLGNVYAPDAETAIKEAIKQFTITNREQ
jgi:hypothetical protein